MPEIMPAPFTVIAALPPRDLGSSYDPVLHGVAGGLAELFPPIHTAQRPEIEAVGEAAGENGELIA